MHPTFEERYKKLNPEQREAVDTTEGPVMVVAGPGTGKTEILTLRIANILKQTDTAPENILALTFTDAAAANMRRRLSNLIGPRAYRVMIQTFHSFCNDTIKNYPEYFPNIIGSGNITEVEGLSILEELIEAQPLQLLRPWGDPLYYIKDVYKKIEELKREGLSPEKFCEVVEKEEVDFARRLKSGDMLHEKGAYKGKMKAEFKDLERQIIKNKELCLLYTEYQKIIHTRRLYDWSDMIMEVLGALSRDEDLKLQLQENHQYILVDEHQDTNNAQNKILELLGDFHKNPNMFIVGDEKQAIFKFQGASMQNFTYFKTLYPSAKMIVLASNYRSGQHILDAAHSLIPTKTELKTGIKKENGDVRIAEFTSKSYELSYVALEVKKLVESGVSPSEIALIYRSNREAFPLAEALERAHVSYVIQSDEDLLSEEFVSKLITILLAIYHYGEDSYLVPLLHIDLFNVDPLVAYRLVADGAKKRVSLYDSIEDTDSEAVSSVAKLLKTWASLAKHEHLSSFLERILRESGMLTKMIESKDADAFLGIERLFEEGKRISENRPGAVFADFMEYIRILRERKIFIKRPKHKVEAGSVHLMTAHRSKGLEFEYVFIIHATEKSFGEKSIRDSLPLLPAVYKAALDGTLKEEDGEEGLAEERRLFYVALTRAKKQVTISYATFDESDKEVLPSPFLLEIREDRKEKIETKEFEEETKAHPEILYAERKKTGVREVDKDFVSELFHSYPMSVTALNNYLSCPWKYFYRNLLRIPSIPERHQLYGTAMHAAVEDLWRVMKERDVGKEFLVDAYERHLGLLGILTPTERSEALERGRQALSGWYDAHQPKLTNPVISEFTIPCVELDGVQIGGKLDKVEMLSDSRGGSNVIVTDYKTGKPKSRNFIEGKTKDGTGDMKRQLQFYKILLRLHDNMDMQKGVIEFLEPNDSGTYSNEEFEIAEEEVVDLTATIKRVAEEITSLAFWNTTCDEKDCEYCGYRKLLN